MQAANHRFGKDCMRLNALRIGLLSPVFLCAQISLAQAPQLSLP
jgi:hypothetical protein